MSLYQTAFAAALIISIASLAIDPDDYHPAVAFAHGAVLTVLALFVCCSVVWALGSVYFWLGAL